MTTWTKWGAIGAAALWLGAAGCTDQKREESTERARTGEDRSVSANPGSESKEGTGATAAGPTAGSSSTGAGATAGAGTSTAQTPDTRTGTATSAEPSASAQAANTGEKTVTGTVVRASADELVLKQEGLDEELTLKVDANTPVMMGGRETTPSALTEGTEVRASYDEDQKATRIDAREAPGSQSSMTGPPGAPGSSGTDTPATAPSGTGTSSVGNPGATGTSDQSGSPTGTTGTSDPSGSTQPLRR